jgi:hypothetical protein
MFLSCFQSATQNYNLITVNVGFENVSKFTYQNHILEEIRSRLNLGRACYHSVCSLLSSCLLSKKLIPVVLYGCITWSLTLKEHILRVFENRVLRRMFGLKTEEVAGSCR